MEYLVIRNLDGSLAENCKEKIGFKIGSFDCTKNCEHNQNTKQEIEKTGFDIKIIRCPKLKMNQLTINI